MADNLAYDLAMFEHRDKKLSTLKKIKPKAAPQSQVQLFFSFVLKFTVALIVGIIISISIYSRVILAETVSNITTAKSQLTRLQSDETRLTMQLDSKISLKSIEEYATSKLGLSRMEKYQITYVALAGDDNIEQSTLQKKQPISININDLFYRLVEYIN